MSVATLNSSGLDDELGQPLPRPLRLAVLAAVIAVHVAGGWALSRVRPAEFVLTEGAPMEVRMVPAEAPQPPVEQQLPPPPEDTPPPKAELESVIQPPPPDLPPPAFPVQAPPPTPAKPKPPPPRPKPVPRQAAPVETAPQPAQPAAPKTVSAAQIHYRVAPHPIYPERARRDGESGRVMLRVMIDASGRPAQVSVATSSGHAVLDESALSAVRAAQFQPYVEGGLPQAVWVVIPISFVLQ